MAIAILGLDKNIIGLLQGTISLEMTKDPDAMFYFGCKPERFKKESIVPTDPKWKRFIDHYSGEEDVAIVNEFKEAVLQADKEGRVQWNCKRYATVLRRLTDNTIVLWDGLERKAEDYNAA